MLYVENLMEFVRLMIEHEESGIFFPQNGEYSNTSHMVQAIGQAHGKKVRLLKGFSWVLKFLGLFTGLVDKAFGSAYKEDYRKYTLADSIAETEK